MTTVRIDASEVHELARDMQRHTDEFPARAQLVTEKALFDIEAIGKVESPYDTGFNAGSISTDIGVLSGEVGPTSDYGGILELGVPHPFVINARPGGMLHFMIDGEDVFAKSVTHPPISPRPYMGPAFDRVLPQYEDALGQLGEQVVGRG
jgi:hypothetical protein